MAYKYKIYTPEVWYSYFGGSASLLIKEDGLIYRGDAEYETFPKPIGKIDFEAGKIYGEDYLDYIKQSIGFIKQRGDVTEIYGTNYYDLGAKPILYIDQNRILSYDEYHRWVSGNPSGFVKEVGTSSYSGSSAVDTNAYSSSQGSYQSESSSLYGSEELSGKPGVFSAIMGILKICITNIRFIIIALLIVASCVWVTWFMFSSLLEGVAGADATIIAIGFGLIVGMVAAWVEAEKYGEALSLIIACTIFVYVIIVLCSEIIAGKFSLEFSYLMLMIGGGVLVGFLACALPALICSAVIILFKRHLKKSQK